MEIRMIPKIRPPFYLDLFAEKGLGRVGGLEGARVVPPKGVGLLLAGVTSLNRY